MEEEIRELRLELKTAQNDVKRYASFALRLQQELAREKQKREERDKDQDILDEEDARFPAFNEKYTGPSGTFAWDKKVDKAGKEHVGWSRKIERVVQMLDGRDEDDEMRCNQVAENVENMIRETVSFLQQQKRFITELGRENAKLRDLRELFGLDEAATRKQILKVATILFGELGFCTDNSPLRPNSSTPSRHPHE